MSSKQKMHGNMLVFQEFDGRQSLGMVCGLRHQARKNRALLLVNSMCELLCFLNLLVP